MTRVVTGTAALVAALLVACNRQAPVPSVSVPAPIREGASTEPFDPLEDASPPPAPAAVADPLPEMDGRARERTEIDARIAELAARHTEIYARLAELAAAEAGLGWGPTDALGPGS